MKSDKLQRWHGRQRYWMLCIFGVVVALVLMLPIVLTLLYSFFSVSEIKNQMELRGNLSLDCWMPLLLIPQMVSLGQYWNILLKDSGILYRFLYSLFYTVMSLGGQAVFAPSMAYALSAFRFRGSNGIFLMLMLLMLLPFQVTMVPNMLVLRSLKLLDTVWAVILPMWFTPFCIFLLRQYMIKIPKELYEAGQLDGAGPINCYVHITLPVCKPVIGAAITLSFADLWNMVEQPLVFLSHRAELQPLSVVFNRLIAESSGTEFAGAVLYMLPALFVYMFFREDIRMGIQMVELK